jgi:hypothetical protein
MIPAAPSPGYDERLTAVLQREDWEALRDFARAENQIPDELHADDRHFWEVMMHKLICNRADTAAQHEGSRRWLESNGYTADLGGY